MTLQVETVLCRTDNYAYIVHDPDTGVTAVVDAPESRAIIRALDRRGLTLDLILITHHHEDHVLGIPTLQSVYGAKTVGHAKDASRLPSLGIAVEKGDSVSIGSETGTVLDVSGHTIGHIAFSFPGIAFTGDSLMALGCGRVFEGTMKMMWESLRKLASLPPDTLIYSGHEYSEVNADFALEVGPETPALVQRSEDIQQKLASGHPTVPVRLSLELETNPFLRAGHKEMKRQLGMQQSSDVEVFTEIRQRRNRF